MFLLIRFLNLNTSSSNGDSYFYFIFDFLFHHTFCVCDIVRFLLRGTTLLLKRKRHSFVASSSGSSSSPGLENVTGKCSAILQSIIFISFVTFQVSLAYCNPWCALADCPVSNIPTIVEIPGWKFGLRHRPPTGSLPTATGLT